MPEVSAGVFLRFAFSSARAKQRLVAAGVRGEWPAYRVPPDHWYRVRVAVTRMIRTGDVSAAAVARALAYVPADRRQRVAIFITGFAAGWPRLRATHVPGRRLSCSVAGLRVRISAHATVRRRRVLYLRYSYSRARLLNPRERTYLELLRRAVGPGETPAVLWLVDGSVSGFRRTSKDGAFVDSQAREFIRLWRANGGQ